MSEKQLIQIELILSSTLIFFVIIPIFVMIGWMIGGKVGDGEGAQIGTFFGLALGLAISYSGFGILIARKTKRQFPQLNNKHTKKLILSWAMIPFIFATIITLFFLIL